MSLGGLVAGGLAIGQATGGLDALMKELGLSNDSWSLEPCAEDVQRGFPKNAVVGQYPPEDVTWRYSARAARTGGLTDDPVLTPTGSDAVGVSFRSSYVPSHAFTNVTPLVDQIASFTRIHPSLHRPPYLLWTFGGRTVRCRIASFQPTLRGVWEITGNARAWDFQIELEKVPDAPTGIDRTVPGEKPRETLHYTLKGVETPEWAALLYLRDPDMGVKVRQRNVAFFPEPTAGDDVAVLEHDHPDMQGAIKPRGVPFASRDGIARLEDLCSLRMDDHAGRG